MAHDNISPSDPRIAPGFVWASETFAGQSIPDKSRTIRTVWHGVSGCGEPGEQATAPARHRDAAPVRGHIRDFLDGDLPPECLYIGRAFRSRSGRTLPRSKWANPFPISTCASTDDCLQKFQAHFLSSGLVADLGELAGMKLLCHCAPGSACHGDILINNYMKSIEASSQQAAIHIGIYASPVELALATIAIRHPFDFLCVPGFL